MRKEMKNPFKIILITIGLFLLTAGYSQANTVVYDKVELFQIETFFTDPFTVFDSGTYIATLTDFEFPLAMISTGMSVTTATDLKGSLMAPGSFLFEATQGEAYFVSFFGFADTTTSLPPLGQYGIEISQVPVPSAVWLFGTGLIGFVGLSRRKKAA